MRKYKIASIIMIIHGGIMELGGCLALVPILAFKDSTVDISAYFSFIVPYLQENLPLMIIIGGIYGIVRVIGAVGLWKNRMWGLALSTVNCIITMALMVFMLPAGIIDGILASSALILIFMQYFGNRRIVE